MWNLNVLGVIVLGLVATVYLLDIYFSRKSHPNEPPYLRPSIPIIGHLIHLGRYGGGYYARLSQGQPEIFTLPIFNFRLYVTNSRHLLPVMQKHAKTISFKPFSKVAVDRFCDASKHFIDLNDESGTHLNELFRVTRNALAPGKGLDYQNLRTGESIEASLFELETELEGVAGGKGKGKKGMELFGFVEHLISIAATDGVFGRNNPFRDPEVESNFWIWARGAGKLTAGIPGFLIRDILRARTIVHTAFEKYCSNDHSDAADVVHARESLYDQNDVALSDKAGAFAVFNVALLPNTVPTTFWTLFDILSRPELLKSVREEIETNAITKTSDQDFEVDVAALRTKCPLLLSSFQETQRTRNVHASIRKVTSDTTIESLTTKNEYFLARGNYLQMPSPPIHNNSEIWGDDALSFDPYRFMKEGTSIPRDKLPESYAFMAWGIAPHICPARQFASTEVFLFVAMMLFRFEMKPSGGVWPSPDLKEGELTTVLPPDCEVLVDVQRRAGWQGEWRLKMGDSGQRVLLASG